MAFTHEMFLEGMTPGEHMDKMTINKERFSQVLGKVEVGSEDKEFFSQLSTPLRVAVFTEDWCGDHVSTTPVLYKLAQDSGKMDVRVFIRADHIDLANSLLPENRWGTVPVFAFFNGDEMDHVALFIETSPELVPVLDGMEEEIRRAHTEVPDIAKDVGEMSESTRNLIRQERASYRINHAPEWGRTIARSMRNVVAEGLQRQPGGVPAVGGTKWPPD